MNNSFKNKVLILFMVLIFIIITLIFLLFGQKAECSDDIVLNDKNIVVKVDEYKLINFEVCENINKKIIFKSMDSSIAKVDNQGYVRGITVGETDIILKYENSKIEEKCHVKVIFQEEKVEPVDEKPKDNKESSTNSQSPQKVTPMCTLSVSNDGIINAKISKASKYSFDKSLSLNETEKNIKDITDKEVKDYEGWKYYRINYYVESETNTKKTCSIIVIEKCNNNKCVYEAY